MPTGAGNTGRYELSRKRLLERTVGALALLAAAYLGLLAFPYPLFSYQASFQNIAVYSDQPIPGAIGPVLRTVEDRLSRSALNDPALQHRVFLCNSNRLFAFFTNFNHRAGGVNYAWLNRNIFLRRSNIDNDRLVGPSGKEVPGERTLDYFVGHEITHSLEVNTVGRYRYLRLPAWKREGYADYIGKGAHFNFADQVAAFRRGAWEMDPARSGLYLRYQLLVTYVMDQKGASAQTLLTQPFDESALENELRAGQ